MKLVLSKQELTSALNGENEVVNMLVARHSRFIVVDINGEVVLDVIIGEIAPAPQQTTMFEMKEDAKPEEKKIGRPSALTPGLHDYIKGERKRGFSAGVICDNVKKNLGKEIGRSTMSNWLMDIDQELKEEQQRAYKE